MKFSGQPVIFFVNVLCKRPFMFVCSAICNVVSRRLDVYFAVYTLFLYRLAINIYFYVVTVFIAFMFTLAVCPWLERNLLQLIVPAPITCLFSGLLFAVSG